MANKSGWQLSFLPAQEDFPNNDFPLDIIELAAGAPRACAANLWMLVPDCLLEFSELAEVSPNNPVERVGAKELNCPPDIL